MLREKNLGKSTHTINQRTGTRVLRVSSFGSERVMSHSVTCCLTTTDMPLLPVYLVCPCACMLPIRRRIAEREVDVLRLPPDELFVMRAGAEL